MELRSKSMSKFQGFLMVCSINLLIVKTLYFNISFYKVFLLNIVIWLNIYIFVAYYKYLKKFSMLFLSMIVVLISLLIPNRILQILFSTRQDILGVLIKTSYLVNSPKVIEFTKWSWNYTFGYTNDIPKNFDLVLLVLIFTFISALFANLIIKRKKIIYFIIPVVFFIIEWFRYIEGIEVLFNIYVLGLIQYYIFINYSEKISKIDKNNFSIKYFDYKPIIKYSSIIIIIIIFSSNVIINTLSLSALNDKMSNMFPGILELRSEYKRSMDSKFAFNNTPYHPLKNRLGGSINNRDVLVMRVKSNKPLLYLRGRVKNIYTGYSWYGDNDDFTKLRKNIIKVDNVRFIDDSEIAEVTIYPDNILTSTVFTPYFPIEVKTNKRKIKYNNDMEMYFETSFLKGKQGSYTIKSILPIDSKGQINIIDHRYIEKSKYLELPENLPDRVYQLANNLTKNYKSQYEKMKVMERYLADNYFYSLKVSDIPEGWDFVDYFLFEDRSGYCTYYASALAVMGRTLGIPTRYVEGFILPQKKGEDGLYDVKLERAHAWIEAYVDDIGWVSLEATSPYYTSWEEETLTEDLAPTSSFEKKDSKDRKYDNLKRMMEEEDIPFIEGNFNFNTKSNKISIGKIILLLILFIISFRTIYLWYRNKKLYLVKDYRSYIIKNYYIIAALFLYIEELEIVKYSPFMLLKVIDKKLIQIDISDDIIDIVNKAFYSNENITKNDIELISDIRSKVEIIVINRIGKIPYFYHKYLLGNLYRKGDVYGTLWKNTSPQC